jgi:RHS repeat-associated protein
VDWRRASPDAASVASERGGEPGDLPGDSSLSLGRGSEGAFLTKKNDGGGHFSWRANDFEKVAGLTRGHGRADSASRNPSDRPTVRTRLPGTVRTRSAASYVADLGNLRIRRISPDGTIATVAGNGSAGVTGNEGPATAASLGSPVRVRVGADRSLYLAETAGNVVRRVGPDGIIRPFAGGGGANYNTSIASSMVLQGPVEIAVGPEGSVYVFDQSQTVRRIDARGVVTTVAGVPGVSTFGGDNGAAALATMGNTLGLRVASDGTIYLAGTADNRVRRVVSALTGFTSTTSTIAIPAQDGSQVYVFDGTGRHQQTLDAFTGAALYTFAYDGSGRLASVTDVNGDVTQFTRNGNNLTSIISPFGSTSTFTADSNGYLASETDPTSVTTSFTYTAGGLLATKTDGRGGVSTYTFDSQGRLTSDQDAAGNAKTLSESDTFTLDTVTLKTPSGVTTELTTTLKATGNFSRENDLPTSHEGELQRTPGGVTSVVTPDSTTIVTQDSPDPRFGMLAPVQTVTTTTPLGQITSTTTTSRAITLSGASLATFLEQTNVNGNTWQRLFNASTRTWTSTSPLGRTQTTIVDAAGRPTQMTAPEVAPFTFTYDAHGHLVATTQGSRTWTQGYDAHGYLASTTDPLGNTIAFTNDGLGRPTTTSLADARSLSTSYDGDGNTSQIVLPSTEAHDFAFTPVNLLSTYTPPSLASGNVATTYSYDADRRLTNLTHPDGASASYAYNQYSGLLTSALIAQGTLSFGYDSNSGYLGSISTPWGQDVSYSYDGFLRTQIAWSGPTSGRVLFGFDQNFRVVSETAAGSAITLTYDADGLLTQAGSLVINRDSSNGRITGTTLGSISDSYSYDANGLFATYGAQYEGSTLYAESVQRDLDGRITQKTETVQGTTHVWSYTYDVNGRLTSASVDGGAANVYGYDADDNRTSFTNSSGMVSATYDAQDRLLTYGTTSYTYTANGDLTTKTTAAGTATYAYDVFGNLLSVALPGNTTVGYIVDGENRRVGRQLNGTTTSGYLYKNALNVVAQLDGSGNLVARYILGSKPNVPDYFTSSAGTFRILSDHLGSPRLIVNTASGAVAEEIDYDEFGNVTNDTNPGLTPFGFGGGLYDAATGLVRFGARDYDASVGRWTSKDPIRFAGGMNAYGYSVNDPVNMGDPSGLDPWYCSIPFFGLLCNAPWPTHAPQCAEPDCLPGPPPGPTPPPPPPPPVSPARGAMAVGAAVRMKATSQAILRIHR